MKGTTVVVNIIILDKIFAEKKTSGREKNTHAAKTVHVCTETNESIQTLKACSNV